MTLDTLADDSRVFIDANVFIYYFTAVAVMWRVQLAHLASADHGFRAVAGLSLVEPGDVHAAP